MRLVEGPAVTPPFAEGLARWLGWTDAIALSGALQTTLTARPGSGGSGAAVEQEFHRVRTSLVRAIADPNEPPAAEADFAPYRRHCVALQQAMEAGIGPLRTQVRAAVARQSPALGRLAAIDAVMEDVLGPHEHSLLAMLPTLLEQHFACLGRAEREAAAAAAATAGECETTPASPASPRPAPWLGGFSQDMQHLLMAELELRLQPVQGLLDALGKTPRIP